MSRPPTGDDYVGEPQYPAPWTTKLPKEGLRDTDEARIIFLAPDVCKTPVGPAVVPIPYPVIDFCGHDQNYAGMVFLTSQKTMLFRSKTSHVHGDQPGTLLGVKSNTVGNVCEPIEYADNVRAEGSNVIRNLDRFWMNNKNTQGEAIFIKDLKPYPTPEDDDPIPGSLRRTDWEEPVVMNAQYAQALPAAVPQPVPSNPVPRPPGQVIRPNIPQWNRPPPGVGAGSAARWVARLGRFGRVAGPVAAFVAAMSPTSTAPPWYDEMPQSPFEEALFDKARELDKQGVDRDEIADWFNGERRADYERRQQEQEKPKPAPLPLEENVRTDRPKCYVLTLTFGTPANGTKGEMQRQLTLQQNALNRKNPCQAAADIANYPNVKAIGEAARARARRGYIRANANALRFANPSLSGTQAMDMARQAAVGKHAIHTLDMVAGGNPTAFSGLGGGSENSSIGSQWEHGGKASQLSEYAQDQCRNRCPLMQTILIAI